MLARKDAVVKQNNEGITYLFKKNKVSFFHGRGSFVKATDGAASSGSGQGYEIKVAGAAEEILVAKQVIVATGSNARALPGTPFDEETILSNDGALSIGTVPRKHGLIGSGGVGLEVGLGLREFGLVLVIGRLGGAYSSIFVATPILAWWKEREHRYRALAERSASRSMREMAMAGAGGSAPSGAEPDAVDDGPEESGPTQPGPKTDTVTTAPRRRQQQARKRK